MFVETYEQNRAANAPDRPTVLDFGCGFGRIARYLSAAESGWRLFGFEVDPKAVAWCNENLPDIEVFNGTREPPSPCPSGSCHFVYSYSVFTHISEEASRTWLHDLRRVTARRAVVALTTVGEPVLHSLATYEAARERFGLSLGKVQELQAAVAANGFALTSFGHGGARAALVGADYGWAFVTPERIQSTWIDREFEVIKHLPGHARGQDLTVLRAI
jgi:cyclopropane fatty-acyl-phospholipid synthase-like methyltransferase